MRDDYEFDEIVQAHTERLVNDHDLDISEARSRARSGMSKSRSYFDDPDALFDDYEED